MPLTVIHDNEEKPWYHKGLKFKCTGCGKCCTGAPGYTWVTEEEILAIADYLKITLDEFGRKYLRKVGNRWSLLEDKRNWDCIFLRDGKCSVYPVRPKQCKTYPWWNEVVDSPETWEREAAECEGISNEGDLIDSETIDLILHS